MYKEGVLEPLSVKEHAVKSAAEAASMILRIDDIVAASKPKEPKGPGPGSLPEGEY
jgi:chaperonin GroEL (HSP60 family)